MKPFDLEKFKAGAVGITREGEEVTFVAYVPEAQEFYRLIYLTCKGYVEQCREDGSYMATGDAEMDIIGLKTQTKTYWINMYEGSCNGYENKQQADNAISVGRINGKSYKVEIEL